MKPDDKLYGIDDWERLENEIGDVIDRVIWETDCEAGEDVLAKIKWPLRIHVFKRIEVPTAEIIADRALGQVIEDLDEEHADPDGNGTTPTDAMKAAALAFAEVIRSEYVCWQCERTGEVIECTREKAAELAGL